MNNFNYNLSIYSVKKHEEPPKKGPVEEIDSP